MADSTDTQSAAASPKAVEVDGVKVTNRSVKELVEAERFAASKAAMRRRDRGVRFTKIRKPGTVGGE